MEKLFIVCNSTQDYTTVMACLIEHDVDFTYEPRKIIISMGPGGDLTESVRFFGDMLKNLHVKAQIIDPSAPKFILLKDSPGNGQPDTFHVMTETDFQSQEDYLYVNFFQTINKEELRDLYNEIADVL